MVLACDSQINLKKIIAFWSFGHSCIKLQLCFIQNHTATIIVICLDTQDVFYFLLGDDLLESVQEIKKEIPNTAIHVIGKSKTDLPDGFSSLSDHMIRTMAVPICKSVRETVPVTHPCCFIYTSGTTGRSLYFLNYQR